MKRILIIIILLAGTLMSYAQQTTITGLVKDVDNEPLMFVTISEEGTTNGTISDESGKFSLTVSSADAKIKFSFVGFQEQIVPVQAGKTYYEIVLQTTMTDLEEVVIVAFGKQKKVSITGSISSTSTEELKTIPTASVSNSLSGLISGVTSVQTNGRPGEDMASLQIRGTSTFNDNSPLVLVDGIERDFLQVPVEEIADISVLKDASATAVYGVRGANGVILVTTKRGTTGAPKFSLNTEIGFSEFDITMDKLNPLQTTILENQYLVNKGGTPTWTAYDMDRYALEDNQTTHFTGDPEDFFKKGLNQRYNFNISGGGKKVKYFVSLGYLSQDGNFETDLDEIYSWWYMQEYFDDNPQAYDNIVRREYDPDYGFKRINFRSNVDINLSQNSDLSVDLAYIYTDKEGPGQYDLFGAYFGQKIGYSWVLPNGTFGTPEGREFNPLETTNYQGYKNDYTSKMQATIRYRLKLDKIIKGLAFRTKVAYDANSSSYMFYRIGYPLYRYDRFNEKYTIQNNTYKAPSYSNGQSGLNNKIYAEVALSYNRVFKKHKVSGLILGNYNSNKQPSTWQSLYGNIPQVYQGLIGRFNYAYDNKYLAEVNMGFNGSNRFSKGKRYAFFPATSLGWVISEEGFLKNNPILNFLKLRTSIGQVGNDKLGGFGYYYDSVWGAATGYNLGIEPTGYKGMAESVIGNENVTWEVATKYNVAIETRWFENLSFSADAFYEKREDILLRPKSYPIVSGVSEMSPQNIGIVENKGIEFELGWNKKVNDFHYYMKFIGSYSISNVIENGEAEQNYDYQSGKGYPIGTQFGWNAIGLFQSWEEIAAAPTQPGNIKPGDIRFEDVNNDGAIDGYDEVAVGYPRRPLGNGSFRAGFEYKGFSLMFLIQGATFTSRQLKRTQIYEFEYGTTPDENWLGSWTPETAGTATWRTVGHSSYSGMTPRSNSYYLQDASYLRLKNMEIGYTLPRNLTKLVGLDRVRIYLNGYNLLTWSDVWGGDPETNADYYYPVARIFNSGLSINF